MNYLLHDAINLLLHSALVHNMLTVRTGMRFSYVTLSVAEENPMRLSVRIGESREYDAGLFDVTSERDGPVAAKPTLVTTPDVDVPQSVSDVIAGERACSYNAS